MAPVLVKRVVFVSSEDALHPAANLQRPGGGSKWLCAAENRSRKAEVELELCKRARIAAIDIANFGSAFVEVKVGSSDLAVDEYITLLPQSSLRTVAESKTGRNRTKLASYRPERLSTAATNKKWNRVRVVCRQPFHLTEQFGLQYIVFHSQASDLGSPVSHFLTPPRTPTPLLSPPPSLGHTPLSTPSQDHSNRDTARHSAKLPHLPSNGLTKNTLTPSAKLGSHQKTPRRPQRDRGTSSKEEEEDFEFNGVEKQSRLFRNALKGKTSGSKPEESNSILQKVISEREKYAVTGRNQERAASLAANYQRRKLLVKDLPKAVGHSDFAASYEKGALSTNDVVGAFNRISKFDNDYEIGTEPEERWGWTKRRRQTPKRGSPSSLGQWLSKKSKLESMVSECKRILNRANGEDADKDTTCSTETTDPPASEEGDEYDTDATVVDDYSVPRSEVAQSTDHPSTSADSPPRMVACPVCGEMYPDYVIELHASNCGDMAPSVLGVVVLD